MSTILANLHELVSSPPEKIGLFDSGIGGISILNELTGLPIKKCIYVADTAHLPYGTKSPEFLIDRAITITRYLHEIHGITTILVACHTSAATTLTTLKKLFPTLQFIDPLPLTTYAALSTTKTGTIGVLATPRSIDSGMHKKLLLSQNLDQKPITVIEQACPLFVDLIENNGSKTELKVAVNLYTNGMTSTPVDTLILGCTHYPFMSDLLQEALPTTKLISAGSCIADLLKDAPKSTKKPYVEFKISGDLEKAQVLLEKYVHKKSVSSYTIAQLETQYR